MAWRLILFTESNHDQGLVHSQNVSTNEASEIHTMPTSMNLRHCPSMKFHPSSPTLRSTYIVCTVSLYFQLILHDSNRKQNCGGQLECPSQTSPTPPLLSPPPCCSVSDTLCR